MISFNFPILKNKLKGNSQIKTKLLSLIDQQKSGELKQNDDYFTDSISRVDWDRRDDTEREWVKLVGPYLQKHFTEEVKKIGLSQVQIFDLWFQQYDKGDTHGWHVHGHNFTGVYYLEFSKDSPRTQIVEPLSLRIIDVDVKQGDVIIFPSMFIHRAPPSKSKNRKTIISFNFNADYVEDNFLKKINEHENNR
ncbi:MAG: hypothetical protein CML17_09890 [Pusillimonas sp.]|jgi:hypothetical protein|nr:hypothetical protein [Pusillimonas sp.]